MNQKELLADFRKRAIEKEMGYRVKELMVRAEWAAGRLQRLADELKEKGADASMNSLGELQGAGPEIDRLCGEIATLRWVKGNFSVLEMQMEKEGQDAGRVS